MVADIKVGEKAAMPSKLMRTPALRASSRRGRNVVGCWFCEPDSSRRPPQTWRITPFHVKAQPSGGGKQQHFGDFGRKGRAFPQSEGRSPLELPLIWTALGRALPLRYAGGRLAVPPSRVAHTWGSLACLRLPDSNGEHTSRQKRWDVCATHARLPIGFGCCFHAGIYRRFVRTGTTGP
jgi:hypothetical protein